MEAILAALLSYMVLMGISTPAGSCQIDNRTESVEDCIAQCPFSTLEGAMNEEKNRLNLWIAFHHPRKAFPQYLVVKYSANVTSDDEYYNKTEMYLWTSNSIYFIIPPHVFSFLSLFIGSLDDVHAGETNLTLPEQCSCWLNGDPRCSKMNYIEILTEKLRGIANVSGYPLSASSYQYQSLAVQKENLANVYHKNNGTFFSFIFVLPTLAVIFVFIIIFSNYNSITKKMEKKEQHKNFAAVVGMGLNIAAYVTALDIWALCWFTDKDHGGREIYFSKEDTKYNTLRVFLIIHVVVESIIYGLGETCFFSKFIKRGELPLFFLYIPPIWCLASHFGFIVIAWSSFVRRGKAITLVYIIGATAMFIVMRQTYKSFILEEGIQMDVRKKVSFRIILVVRVVGFILVGALIYIMWGLWLVPASETVEDSPVYLSDSLHLIIVVLAILVSYKISFGDDEVVELLKKIKNGNDKVVRLLENGNDEVVRLLENGNDEVVKLLKEIRDERPSPRDEDLSPRDDEHMKHL